MKGICFFALLLLTVATCLAEGPQAALPRVDFPLDLAIIDPEANDKQPPYIIVFDEGRDQNDKDVRGPLGRLEALRGPSKLFPESNKDDGLPVVLRGLRIHAQRDGAGAITGYEVELQGEFNMVKVPAPAQDVERLLAGKPAKFVLKAEKNYGVYAYVSTTTLELQLIGGELYVRKLAGDFTFREGLYTYTSKTKRLSPPAGRSYLYRGERAELPTLPSI